MSKTLCLHGVETLYDYCPNCEHEGFRGVDSANSPQSQAEAMAQSLAEELTLHMALSSEQKATVSRIISTALAKLIAENEEAKTAMRALVKNVGQPELKGDSTLVLYFPNEADREEFISAFREAKPNCKTVKL